MENNDFENKFVIAHVFTHGLFKDDNKLLFNTKEEALRSLRIIEKRINNYKSVYSYNMKTMGDKHTDTLLKLYEPIFLIRDYLINNNLISKDESLEDGINKLNSKIYVIKGDTNELDWSISVTS